MSKLKEQNEDLLEHSNEIICNDDYEQLKSKMKHKRVVSAHYNSNNLLINRLSPHNNENMLNRSKERESRSIEKKAVYQNYMSNQNEAANHEYILKKYKKVKSKRGS